MDAPPRDAQFAVDPRVAHPNCIVAMVVTVVMLTVTMVGLCRRSAGNGHLPHLLAQLGHILRDANLCHAGG